MVSFAESARLIYLLIPALFAVAVVLRHRQRCLQQRELASPAVWERLMGGTPSTGLWRMLLWCGAAALIILALARPQWGAKDRKISIQTRDVVFALDLSKSMQCPDVEPDRLQCALSAIRHSLPGLDGNRLGVVIFAGGAYPLVPLTTDLEAVGTFLDGVEPNMVSEPGSNLQAAAEAAVKLLPPEGEGRVLVLFSDGENLQGDPEEARKTLKEAGVSFVGVMVGTTEGGPIPELDASGSVHYKRDRDGQTVVTHADPATLKTMAKALGGKLIVADHGETEKKLVAAIAEVRTREMETKQKPEKIERFPLFLGASALLLILSFFLSPWRRRAHAAVLGLLLLTPGLEAQQAPPPGSLTMPQAQQQAGSAPTQALPPASAADPSQGHPETQPPPKPEVSWWQRLVPGGVRRLARSGLSAWKKGDTEKATEKFGAASLLEPENTQRLYDYGTALAASGHRREAVPLLDKAGALPGAHYNAGTAALQAQKADVALQHLRKALLDSPQDPDIKRNYELALRLLEKQKQQQQKKQDDTNKKQKNQKKQEQQKKKEEQKRKEQQQKQQGAKATPTPVPGGQAQPQPSPTPDPKAGLYSALQRSESEARKAMRTPVPSKSRVEKDW